MSSSLKEILRLALTTTWSNRQVGRVVGRSANTVGRYRRLASAQSLTWADLAERSIDDLDALFNRALRRTVEKEHPDWAWVHDQMQLRGMTRTLLWEEYRRACPEHALAYSQFSHHYRAYIRKLHPVMRQHHSPGERVFVDFSGRRPFYVDPETGERIVVELFIGVLGYSNYVFALACPSQQVPQWIKAHVLMFDAFGGAPRVIVPDNLRSAVTRPGQHPIIHRTYQEMASHYGSVVLPARARRPKDKAKVEGSVLIVQRWVLLRLRHRTFFSLTELNQAIAELVAELNRRPFKKLEGSRIERFGADESAVLQPLPAVAYEHGEWTSAQTVPADYHVRLGKHWYSVPFTYIGCAVEGRLSADAVEIYCSGIRIASHRRGIADGTTTDPGHLPKHHAMYAERTPEHFVRWAVGIGPATTDFVQRQFQRAHPGLGLPCCDRLQALARKHGAAELEAAVQRALDIRSPSEKTVRALLASGRHRSRNDSPDEPGAALPEHRNIRGSAYFAPTKEAIA
ncbi:MAG TPA: IS21 family transposase [Rhodanobacter sp.]